MLKEETIHDIEMFEKIIESIDECYRKLLVLDCRYLKESKEYLEELESLKKWVSLENSVLERFKVSGEFEEIISYFSKKYEISIGISICFSDEPEDIIKSRITNRLFNAWLSLNWKESDGFKAMYIAELYNDIIKLVLSIFEHDKNINNYNQKAKFKYSFAEGMKSIEEELVSNNFEIGCKSYVGNGLLVRGEREKAFAKYVKLSETTKMVNFSLGKLLYSDDDMTCDAHDFYATAFTNCIIRACLILVPEEYADLTKEKIELVIQALEKDNNPRNKIIHNLLCETISSSEKDKEIPMYLSLVR